MDDYSVLSDEVLQRLSSEGDSRAEEALAERFGCIVRVCARPYFLAGGDSEDLMQEGMLGLLTAIRSYDPSQNTSFRTFAELCIRSRILSAIKAASRLKHAPLNEGISLETVSEEDSDGTYPVADFRRLPEEQVLARESDTEFFNTFSRCLSPLENKVLHYFLEGLSYQSIAAECGKDVKAVDNAVQRIRRKLARQLRFGDSSES